MCPQSPPTLAFTASIHTLFNTRLDPGRSPPRSQIMRRFAIPFTISLVAAFGARAAESLEGNWRFVTVGPGTETTVAILKVENKDGKPCATVLFKRPNVEITVTDFKVSDTGVTLALKQAQMAQQRRFESTLEFIGVRGTDSKMILGSTGDDRF